MISNKRVFNVINVMNKANLKNMVFVLLALFAHNNIAYSQNIEDVRWKSQSHVRSLYGEPQSIVGPVGTHASYTLWKYEGFSVAFSNKRVFHLFDENSLSTLQLDEER